MTQQRDQGLDRTTDSTPATQRPRLEVSATTITTGVVASTVSALLGSTLGIAGTLLGAATGAVAYALVSALYVHSVAAAKFRLQVARVRAGRTVGDPVGFPGADSETGSSAGRGPDRLVEVELRSPRRRRSRSRTGARSGHWRAVLAGTLGSAFAFALALVLVTGIESAKGAPLAGGSAGGLSVLGGASYGNPDPTWLVPAPADQDGSGSDAVTQTSTATETATETATLIATSTETTVVTSTQTPQSAPRSISDATTVAPSTDHSTAGTVAGTTPSVPAATGAPTASADAPATGASAASSAGAASSDSVRTPSHE